MRRFTAVIVSLACWGLVASCSDGTSETTVSPPIEVAPPTTATSTAPTPPATVDSSHATGSLSGADLDLTSLWSYGLISVRTGEPIVFEGGRHLIDPSDVSYGYNLVVDAGGTEVRPGAVPLVGGERLVVTSEYQDGHNTREFARVVSYMAPIRDALLYGFEDMSRAEWLDLTEILTLNEVKTTDAPVVDGRAILSTRQVYDYIASGEAEGSPVARYLEEAELELKCLAFQDFDFMNPEGVDHCAEHGLVVGSGLTLP